MKPQRIQRTADWKPTKSQVWVGPRSKFNNPFGNPNGEATASRQYMVDDFRFWLTIPTRVEPRSGVRKTLGGGWDNHLGASYASRQPIVDALESLRGKDLVCACHLSQPCHADVLLELANQDEVPE